MRWFMYDQLRSDRCMVLRTTQSEWDIAVYGHALITRSLAVESICAFTEIV